MILFGPTLPGRPVTGTIAYALITVLTIVLALTLTIRATTTRRAVLGGCGTLIIGTVVAVGALLVLIS